MIDIDKTIEGDAVLSTIKYCALSERPFCRIYNLAGVYLLFRSVWHNIEVQLLTDRVDKKTLSDIADFLEDDKAEKTVYDILKKIQPICGLITVDGASVEMKKNESNNANLSIETLKQMGYNYPCTARRIIEAIEQGEDPKSIDSGLIKSLLTAEGHGHIFHSFILSYTKIYPEEPLLCNENKDRILLIDRKWVPSKNRRILGKVVEAIRDGKSVEEALECLKEEETEEGVKPEEDTQTPKAPNHEAKEEEDPDEEFAEKEEGEQPEANPDPTMEEVDLRNALSFCKDIFEKKLGLYGGSFCFIHPETVTDQLYMKAAILKKRLTERDKGERFEYDFFEGVRDEFAAVVNYGIIALRQSVFSKTKREFEAPDDLMQFYLEQTRAALSLICDKSADYGHLWRSQRIGTFADMIYTKVLRVKRIENQYRVGGMTEEGYHKFVEDQYRDMINYGLFGVVRTDDICNVLALTVYEDEEEFE